MRGASLHRSVVDRARSDARRLGTTSGELVRRFYYGRFLRRVFTGEGWVLKGGSAMLARVAGSRHTLDIDLLHIGAGVDGAVDELRRLLAVDVDDDGIRFEVVTARRRGGAATAQPGIDAARLSVEAFCGAKRASQFSVDLVVGSLMTEQPASVLSDGPHMVPGLPAARLRLYPVVDHIADKVAATEATYAGGRPSERVRDLVDLVVITRSLTVDGAALHHAIGSERAYRRLPHRDQFVIPAGWAQTYPGVAASIAACGDLPQAEDALTVVRALVEPAMTGGSVGSIWSVEDQAWIAVATRVK